MNAPRCLRRDGYRFTAQHKAWLPGWATQHLQIGASLRVVIPVATMNRDAVPSNLVLEFLEGGSVYEATHRLGKSFLG